MYIPFSTVANPTRTGEDSTSSQKASAAVSAKKLKSKNLELSFAAPPNTHGRDPNHRFCSERLCPDHRGAVPGGIQRLRELEPGHSRSARSASSGRRSRHGLSLRTDGCPKRSSRRPAETSS